MSDIRDERLKKIEKRINELETENSFLKDVLKMYWNASHSDDIFDCNPCINCSNNPKNGGSGVCNCILGSPNIK